MKHEKIENILHINQQQLHAYSTGLLQGTAYSRLHSNLNQALLPFRISIPEWKLLGQLHQHGNIKLSDLANLLSYEPPMVTKLAKILEKKDLITRAQDKNDERIKIITITSLGSKLIEDIEPHIKGAMAKMLQGISREELNIYVKVLIAIVNNTNS